MSKVTLGDLKEVGFKAVCGDAFYYLRYDGVIANEVVNSHNLESWNENDRIDFAWIVKSLAPRPNTGTQPVADDFVVEVTYNNESKDKCKASEVEWSAYGGAYAIKSWIPHLPTILEQQMNDSQESAMNISERDIENAFIQQEDAVVEREMVESDEWVNGDPCVYHNGKEGVFIGLSASHPYVAVVEFMDGMEVRLDKLFVSDLSKPLTPEQLAAKELFELSFKSVKHAGLSFEYKGDWGKVSEEDKRYWIHFAKQLNFKQ